METKQYSLCEEVLRRLHGAGVLQDLVVTGSWCVLFYRAYFDRKAFTPTIRTRDIDFAVPVPPRFDKKVDVADLLDGLGFVHRPGTVLLDENLTLNKTKSYDIMYMHRVHNRDAVFA